MQTSKPTLGDQVNGVSGIVSMEDYLAADERYGDWSVESNCPDIRAACRQQLPLDV